MLQQEALMAANDGLCSSNLEVAGLSSPADIEHEQDECNRIFFKSDQMYRHHLARFNYTTYDIRRSQDVINPNTSHHDVVLLAKEDTITNGTGHRFLYARVLGIYHVNVIYTGPGALDHGARKIKFLWVRWFEYAGNRSLAWRDCRLDSLHFPPVASDDAFGFIDPRDVLRGCHLVPAFASGRVHLDRIGISHCASDSHDWRYYYVNRYDYFCLTFLGR